MIIKSNTTNDITKNEQSNENIIDDLIQLKIISELTVTKVLNKRCYYYGDDPMIVAKPNLFSIPFRPKPNKNFPSPYLAVTFKEYSDLAKSYAYVLKQKYNIQPHTRVGIMGDASPIHLLLIYAVWYLKGTIVEISIGVGEEVVQAWMTTTDVFITFYNSALPSFPSIQNINTKEKSDWVWTWTTNNGGTTEKKSMTMINMESDILNAEILSANKSGYMYEEELEEDDIVTIIGTSSTTQAIVKDGIYTTMKFVPGKNPAMLNAAYWKQENAYKKPKILYNLGFGSAIGQRHGFMYCIMTGGPIIFGTKNKKNLGIIPEVMLDDIDVVKPDICFIFPYMLSIWKYICDSKHPDWPRWKKALKSRPKWCFATGGAPVDPEIYKWLKEELNIQLNNIYGSSEAGMVHVRNEYTIDEPGEENYVSICPGVEWYLDPINSENKNEGELYVYSNLVFTGYVDKAKEGDPDAYHGIIVNKWRNENFKLINGKYFYKTNDLWKRSPKTGNFCYISRVDDVIVFKTGVKMNPIPFESTMTLKCKSIKNCCLLLEKKNQTEVFLFVEPEWNQIKGITILSSENMKSAITKKIVKDQIWKEVSKVLTSEVSSMANWVKQISKHSLYVLEYGQTIPTTLKGNVSRRNCKIFFNSILDELSDEIPISEDDNNNTINNDFNNNNNNIYNGSIYSKSNNSSTSNINLCNINNHNNSSSYNSLTNSNNNNNIINNGNNVNKDEDYTSNGMEEKRMKSIIGGIDDTINFEEEIQGEDREERGRRGSSRTRNNSVTKHNYGCSLKNDLTIHCDNIRPLSQNQNSKNRSSTCSLLDLKKLYENEKMNRLINMIYSCIVEIIPSTVPFNEFNADEAFSSFGLNSINSIKLIKLLNSKLKTNYSTVMLFNYNSPTELAKALASSKNSSNSISNNVMDSLVESYDSMEESPTTPSCGSIPKSLSTDKSLTDNLIAIVGIGLRLPGGINSTQKFWLSLIKGRNCLSNTPTDRQLHQGFVDMQKNPNKNLDINEHYIGKYGYYESVRGTAKPTDFDADFFECSKDEAIGMDVKQRWILETSWEALEDAGIDPSIIENSNTGIFVGMNNCNHHVKLMASKEATNINSNYNSITTHGTELCSVAGRLSYFYKLYGPAISIDTACSTGATAVHVACRSIQMGECDLAIVSGARYLYYNDEFINTSHAKMTSPNNRCATFDESADGFASSEGCVTLILKRLDEAEENNDNIYGVILGSSNGQSGGRQSISVPSSEAQERNIRNAMKNANVSPKDISYIEAHGTGTPYGDALEIHAINQIFGHTHTQDSPLYIGSVKTNIGHTCEASGLAGLVKVLLSMKHQLIPKHINFRKINPEINLDLVPLNIPYQKCIPWKSSDPTKPLIAEVSSYGLQGSVTNIILQQYIPPNWKAKPRRTINLRGIIEEDENMSTNNTTFNNNTISNNISNNNYNYNRSHSFHYNDIITPINPYISPISTDNFERPSPFSSSSTYYDKNSISSPTSTEYERNFFSPISTDYERNFISPNSGGGNGINYERNSITNSYNIYNERNYFSPSSADTDKSFFSNFSNSLVSPYFNKSFISENEDEDDEDEKLLKKYYLLTISAKTYGALTELIKKYLNKLEEMEEDKKHWKKHLANFCFSSNLTRKHFNLRISVTGDTISEIIDQLESRKDNLPFDPHHSNTKLINNSQWKNSNIMMYYGTESDFNLELVQFIKETYQYYDYYKECFIYCEQKIQCIGGGNYPMFNTVFNPESIDIESLDPMVKCLIIFSHFYSLHKLFLYFNININAIGGENIGEFLALAVSGALTLDETLKLLIKYYNFYEEKREKNLEDEIKTILSVQKPLCCCFYSNTTKKLNKTGQPLDENYWRTFLTKSILEKEKVEIKENNQDQNQDNENENENKDEDEDEDDELSSLMIKQKIIVNPQTIRVESSSVISSVGDTQDEDESIIKNIYEMVNILYMNGENINWTNFNYNNINSHYKKVHLPFYQFQRSYYWPITQKSS